MTATLACRSASDQRAGNQAVWTLGTRACGVLGARPLMAQTFHGGDPDTVAASAICDVTPTRCQARTRLYRDGRLELEGFPVAEISDTWPMSRSPSGLTCVTLTAMTSPC
jgi:hypothetical protein